MDGGGQKSAARQLNVSATAANPELPASDRCHLVATLSRNQPLLDFHLPMWAQSIAMATDIVLCVVGSGLGIVRADDQGIRPSSAVGSPTGTIGHSCGGHSTSRGQFLVSCLFMSTSSNIRTHPSSLASLGRPMLNSCTRSPRCPPNCPAESMLCQV